MQNQAPIRSAVPADVLALLSPGQIGPAPEDWRIAELAEPGATGEPGWVAVRVHPFTVLPLVEDQETAEVLAAMYASREGVSVWVWTPRGWATTG